MEAKDTVRTYNELKAYCEEKGIALPIQPDDLKLAAAEISLKAGQEALLKEMVSRANVGLDALQETADPYWKGYWKGLKDWGLAKLKEWA